MSAPLELGETYQYRHTVTDINGVPTNAGSPPTVTITKPDGTIATPTVVNSGAGLYDFDYLTTQVGRHTLLGSATGGTLGSATEKFDDVFNVEPPGRMLLGVDEAASEISDVTSRDDREKLRWRILAVSEQVERYLGRTIARRAGLVSYFHGGNVFQVPRPPLLPPDGFLTVTSVVENGVTLTEGTDFIVLRNPSWAIVRGTATSSRSWYSGYNSTVFTYTAGCLSVPADLRQVVKNRIRQEWQGPAVSQVAVGQVSITYSSEDQSVLDRYRVVGVG